MQANLVVARNTNGTFPLEFYFGPNRFKTLQPYGNNLQKLVYMGWPVFAFINRWAVLPVFNFLNQFNWNYGLIILALTIILKLVLSPLT